jgi:hypothetical protein
MIQELLFGNLHQDSLSDERFDKQLRFFDMKTAGISV